MEQALSASLLSLQNLVLPAVALVDNGDRTESRTELPGVPKDDLQGMVTPRCATHWTLAFFYFQIAWICTIFRRPVGPVAMGLTPNVLSSPVQAVFKGVEIEHGRQAW